MLARWASKQEKREREKKHVVKIVLKTEQKPLKNCSKREVESNLERSVQKVEKTIGIELQNGSQNDGKRDMKMKPLKDEIGRDPGVETIRKCGGGSGDLGVTPSRGLSKITACQKTDIGHQIADIRKLTAKTSDIR